MMAWLSKGQPNPQRETPLQPTSFSPTNVVVAERQMTMRRSR